MRKLFISISTLLFAACAPKFPALTPDEFEQKIAEPDVQLVDVRTPEEYCQVISCAATRPIRYKDN